MSQPTNASLSPLAQSSLTLDPGALNGSASQQEQPFDPSAEDAYWRDHYIHRPYADQTLSYDYYRPAYRYGWESRTRFMNRRWDQVEKDLGKGWREHRGPSRLGWTDAKQAARDAWVRVDQRLAELRALEP
jgi:hypothetical protein